MMNMIWILKTKNRLKMSRIMRMCLTLTMLMLKEEEAPKTRTCRTKRKDAAEI